MNNESHWTLSSNIVVLTYPPLAGGHFIQNMLGYYGSFMSRFPADSFPNDHDLPATDINDKILLDKIRHRFTMKSVPPYALREYWYLFEGFTIRFWGVNLQNHIEGNPFRSNLTNVNGFITQLLTVYYCINNAHERSVDTIRRVHPNCTIISLVDADELREISKPFKTYHINSNLTEFPLYGDNVYNFSMKNVFNKELFFQDLSDLAMKISGNCTYSPLMEEYYDAYIAVHK